MSVPPPPPKRPLPIGPAIASVGAVLLIVSLFLDWYEDISGFTVFEFLDLLLVLLALATIASLAGSLGLTGPRPSPAVSLAVAIFTVFVVASQLINDPPAVAGSADAEKAIGIWLALAGSALMVVGALLAYARISLSVEAREP
jgi:ABC-type transport system involved in cytochrome c biogenesis permease subunit